MLSYQRTSPSEVGLKCALFILSACLLLTKLYFKDDSLAQNNDDINYDDSTIQRREKRAYSPKGSEAFLINTPGCKIPNYGKNIVYKESKDLKGSCGQRAVFVRKVREDWRTFKLIFQIDEDKLLGHLKNIIKYECCYSFVERSKKPFREDSHIIYNECKTFRNGSNIAIIHEVLTVKCYNKKNSIQEKKRILYEDAYIFIKKIPRNSMVYDEESWNVLMIGIDTMSRARILSTMPKLAKHLQRQGWLDYKGYHKVAANTLPNLSAVLTGKKSQTIEKLCKFGFENCNDIMIWSKFRQLGYITAFGEDFVRLPDTFSVYNGFRTAPTHHYMRPFFLTGETQRGNLICAKQQSSVKHLLDYAYDFVNTYVKGKFFGVFWMNSICHNTNLLPSLHENDMINFIENISSTRALSNTFILLFSDHGIRFGPSRMQMESYYDDKLPVLFIWVPTDFQKKHEKQYRNMLLNQNRLVTHYDIYLTLAKISKMSKRSSDIVSEACPSCNNLFEVKSPHSTCVTGGVLSKWCSCRSLRNADTFTDIDAFNAIQFAVHSLQNYSRTVKTNPCKACYPLLLQKVHRVHSYTNGKSQKNYVIALQMVADDPDKRKQKLPKMSYEVSVMKDKNEFTVLLMDTIETYYSNIGCAKYRGDRGFCLCKYVKNCARRKCRP